MRRENKVTLYLSLLVCFLLCSSQGWAQTCTYGGSPSWVTTSVTDLNAPFDSFQVKEEDLTCFFLGLPVQVLETRYTIFDAANNCAQIMQGTFSAVLPIFNTGGLCPAGQYLSLIDYHLPGTTASSGIFRAECMVSGLIPIPTGNMYYTIGSGLASGQTASRPAC